MLDRFFGGEGACTTICNATIGLMLAIKEAIGEQPAGQFALMPTFTFAAAAHAALWCGLTPLLCDIHPTNWAADPAAELEMLSRYAGKIAIVMPYATFGYPIDLEHYKQLAAQLGVPVVVDAAASLGTFDEHGHGFGSGFAGSVVYSMHATKSFAVGEAGLIYSADKDRIARIRIMSSFGFGEPRTATMAGLNGKLSEVNALLGRLRLTRLRQRFGTPGRAVQSLSRCSAGIAVSIDSARHAGPPVCAGLIALWTGWAQGGYPCGVSRSGDRNGSLL